MLNGVNKVDLHMHSTLSDGTDTPEELIKNVKEAGISVFSITDHDSIESAKVMKNMEVPEGVKYITGVEFSCVCDNGMQCHILGYGYDPENEEIISAADISGSGRKLDARTAIKAISHAGGIPVLAHGLGAENEKILQDYEFDDLFDELAKSGIKGLEVLYSKYDNRTSGRLFRKAKLSGMYISGGSDYQGHNNGARLGQLNVEDTEVDTDMINIISVL